MSLIICNEYYKLILNMHIYMFNYQAHQQQKTKQETKWVICCHGVWDCYAVTNIASWIFHCH